MPKSEQCGGPAGFSNDSQRRLFRPVAYDGQMVPDGFLACSRYHLHGIPKRPDIPMQPVSNAGRRHREDPRRKDPRRMEGKYGGGREGGMGKERGRKGQRDEGKSILEGGSSYSTTVSTGKWFAALSSHLRNLVWTFKSSHRRDDSL